MNPDYFNDRDKRNGFVVAPEYRTNPLSHIPTDTAVLITSNDNRAPRLYTNIHHPDNYIQAVFRSDPTAISGEAIHNFHKRR